MHALLAYGSLIHPDELARHTLRGRGATPVRVQGFRRSFCQEPSWRAASGLARGVLTVRPSPGEWFNALLVPGLTESILPGLDERERGYRRVEVEAGQLEPYPGAELPRCVGVHLYTGRSERYNEEILPHRSYLDLCVEGARRWGARFLRDFCTSTYVRNSTSLLQLEPDLARPAPASG